MHFLAAVTWFSYTLVLLYAFFKFYKVKKMVSATFCFFSLYFLSIRPIFILSGLDLPIPSYIYYYDFWEDIVDTNLIINLWVFTSIGLLLFFQKHDKFNDKEYVIGDLNWLTLTYITIALTLLGSIITLYFIIQSGGLSEFVYLVKIGKSFAGMYVFREISTWALALSGLLFLNWLVKGKKVNSAIAVSLILINCIVIFSWGNRTIIGFFLFLLAFVYASRISKVGITKVLLFAILMVVLANGLRALRDDFRSEAVGRDINSQSTMTVYTSISLSLHFSQYDGLLLANKDVGERFDYRYGEDFYNGLLAWVPRFLWKDKPETHNVGLWFRQVYEPFVSNGWPITTIGDWLVNGGVLLVFLGAILTALLIRVPDSKKQKSLVFDYLSMIFAVFVLNQGLSTAFIQKSILVLLPIILIITLCKFKFVNGR